MIIPKASSFQGKSLQSSDSIYRWMIIFYKMNIVNNSFTIRGHLLDINANYKLPIKLTNSYVYNNSKGLI